MVKNLVLKFCTRKSAKFSLKITQYEKINCKQVKIHKFLVCAYKSWNFAQSQENFARSHDRVTVTFRNSDYWPLQMWLHRKRCLAYSCDYSKSRPTARGLKSIEINRCVMCLPTSTPSWGSWPSWERQWLVCQHRAAPPAHPCPCSCSCSWPWLCQPAAGMTRPQD